MRRSLLVLTIASAMSLLASDVQRGIELYNAKQYSEAAKEFEGVLADDAENADAKYYLGLSLLGMDKTSEAKKVLESADEVEKSDKVKVGLARVYLGEKNLEKAGSELTKAASINPDNPDLPFYQGIVALGKKQYDQAAKLLEKALAVDPDNDYAHYHLGMAYSGLKRSDKMVNHFETFLKRQPDAPEAKKVEAVLKAVR